MDTFIKHTLKSVHPDLNLSKEVLDYAKNLTTSLTLNLLKFNELYGIKNVSVLADGVLGKYMTNSLLKAVSNNHIFFKKLLKDNNYTVDAETLQIFLIVEYLLTEFFEVAGNTTITQKKTMLTSEHVETALGKDPSLSKTIENILKFNLSVQHDKPISHKAPRKASRQVIRKASRQVICKVGRPRGSRNRKASRKVGRPRGSHNRKASRKVGRPRGSRNRASRKVGRPRGSRNRASRKVGRPRGSRNRASRKVGRPRGSRNRASRKVGRPRGSRNSKTSRKVGRPRGSRNRK